MTRCSASWVDGGSGPATHDCRSSPVLSARLDLPTIDGFEIIVPDDESAFPIAPTAGVEVHKLLSPRASLFASARYAYLHREETIRYLGIGPHVLRVGGGVRVRLN